MRGNKSGGLSPSLSIVLAMNAFLVAGALAGCEPNPARPITSTGAHSIVTGDADPSDPFGSCVIGDSGNPNFPLVCSDGGVCSGADEGITCSGNGTSCTPDVFHVLCTPKCSVDADCPVPLTGTARLSCNTEFHYCQLDCSGGRDCPTGSTCQDGTRWLAKDIAGNSVGLPQMCMQTITIQIYP